MLEEFVPLSHEPARQNIDVGGVRVGGSMSSVIRPEAGAIEGVLSDRIRELGEQLEEARKQLDARQVESSNCEKGFAARQEDLLKWNAKMEMDAQIARRQVVLLEGQVSQMQASYQALRVSSGGHEQGTDAQQEPVAVRSHAAEERERQWLENIESLKQQLEDATRKMRELEAANRAECEDPAKSSSREAELERALSELQKVHKASENYLGMLREQLDAERSKVSRLEMAQVEMLRQINGREVDLRFRLEEAQSEVSRLKTVMDNERAESEQRRNEYSRREGVSSTPEGSLQAPSLALETQLRQELVDVATRLTNMEETEARLSKQFATELNRLTGEKESQVAALTAEVQRVTEAGCALSAQWETELEGAREDRALVEENSRRREQDLAERLSRMVGDEQKLRGEYDGLKEERSKLHHAAKESDRKIVEFERAREAIELQFRRVESEGKDRLEVAELKGHLAEEQARRLREDLCKAREMQMEAVKRESNLVEQLHLAALRRAEPATVVPVVMVQPLPVVVRDLKPTEPVRWHLKLDDGSIFGPVSTQALLAWVAECRIGPDHQVSKDAGEWLSARQVPELKMEWSMTLVDGTEFGPVNRLAIPTLLQDGAIEPAFELKNIRTGEVLTADRVSSIPDVVQPPMRIKQQIQMLRNAAALPSVALQP
jgi:hypothetical protein